MKLHIFATCLLGFVIAASSSMAAAVSDDDLIAIHSHVLSPSEMAVFGRELRMNRFRRWFGNENAAQGGGPGIGGGMRGRNGGMGGLFPEEHTVVMSLLENRELIERTITELYDQDTLLGVITNTTSAAANVAGDIKEHVSQMKKLVEDGRLVRQRDPLYAELFRRKGEITMTITPLKHGVSVVQTGSNDCASELIKEHATVVTNFLEKGRAEVRANHALPGVCLGE